MTTPTHERDDPEYSLLVESSRSSGHNTIVSQEMETDQYGIYPQSSQNSDMLLKPKPSASQIRADKSRLQDELRMLEAERVASMDTTRKSSSLGRSKSRKQDPIIDEFDVNTNPIHEQNAAYKPVEGPSTNIAKFFRKLHESSVLIRYFMYIIPVAILLLVPLLVGAVAYGSGPDKRNIGGVDLLWFSIWLEVVWLTLWAGRIASKMIPWPVGLFSSIFTDNGKKWRDLAKQIEIPLTLFFWALATEISFIRIMSSHQVPDYTGDFAWIGIINKVIISALVLASLNLVEKFLLQLIAINFHLRTYADRLESNSFQIASLVKLYSYSKTKIAVPDSEFENPSDSRLPSGSRTPMQYVEKAQIGVTQGFRKVGDIAGRVAGDFTGRQITNSTSPRQVCLTLLKSNSGSPILARRLYRTFVREGQETISSEDLKPAFDSDEEAEAAFNIFDRDLNGDVSMEELEAVCVEVGREGKSITASLKDLDSVVSKLGTVFLVVIIFAALTVLITLVSDSATNVLMSAGSTVLALSWLFSATAQEFLQSIIFVFVKHPFDVGDRVSVYGNTGTSMKGDDYYVKEISLLYTEFKKMEGHVVQAPNSYLNNLFILNQRRSGGLAEAVPVIFKFGTTLEQLEELRKRLLEFVKEEKREYQNNILTEIRDVLEAHSITVNVVFFYKSNWQNEGLRLQRRNKFICALMVAMQDLGIEGPRMRLPGQRNEQPFYVHYEHSFPPSNSTPLQASNNERQPSADSQDPPFVPEAVPGRNFGSIMRQSGSAGPRGRGESLSSMAKRVDFSLGGRDNAFANYAGDVYDDAPRKARLPDIARVTASTSERRPSGSDHASLSSIDRSGLLYRTSTEDSTRLGHALGSIHRKRFFGRISSDEDHQKSSDLMERGMAAIPEASSRLNSRSGPVNFPAYQNGMNTPASIRNPIDGNDIEMDRFLRTKPK